MKKKKVIVCLLVGILVCIFYIGSFFVEDKNYEVDAIVEDELINAVEEGSKVIKVDIKGAVKNPGVYEVPKDSRIVDVIKVSGGLTNKANTEYINLSKIVDDEMVIWIYTNEEIKKFKQTNTKYEYIVQECQCPDVTTSACISDGTQNSSKININTAELEALMALSGIGESKAMSIIEYREKTPFKTIDELKNVSGIGDSAFDKIKEYITV